MKTVTMTQEQFEALQKAVRKLKCANTYIPKRYEKRAGIDCRKAAEEAELVIGSVKFANA